MFLTAASAFVCYSCLHLIADMLFKRYSKKMKILSNDDRIYIAEKICSTVNALIVGLTGIYLLIFNDLFDDPWDSFPALLEIIYPVYFGYSLYDMITMWFQKQHWSMWLHHILGFFGAFFMNSFRSGAYYTTWFMITEITAVMDNSFWYLKTLYISDLNQKSQKRWDQILSVLRAISFVIIRLPIGPLSLYKSTFKFKSDIGLLGQWLSLPWHIFVPGMTMIILFTLLNTVWTIVIVKKAINKFKKKKE